MKRVLMMAVVVLAGAWSAIADMVTFDSMLILATDEPAPLDRRLARVEHQLRPLFRFPHYRHLGESSVSVNLPGTAQLALGDGNYLSVRGLERDGRIWAEVRWMRGEQALLSTAVNLQRGKPVILGGAPHDKGKLIVTLTAR